MKIDLMLKRKEYNDKTKKVPAMYQKEIIEKILSELSKVTSAHIAKIAYCIEYESDIPLYNRFNDWCKLKTDSTSKTFHQLKYGHIWEEKYSEKIKNTRITREKMIEKYGTELGEQKWNECNIKRSKSLDGFMYRYGEGLGKQKYEEYWKNTNFSTSLAASMRRHGPEKGEKIYAEIKKNIGSYYSVKNLGQERYDNRRNKQSKLLKTLKYPRDNCSLVNFIKRHGQEEGEKRYKQYLDKISVRFGKASKSSLKIFIPLYKYIRKLNIARNDIFFGIKGSSELRLFYDKKYMFLYDFTIKSKKLIIEFNGKAFHPNPKMSEEEWKNWKHARKKSNADECHKRDMKKISIAQDNEYKVLVLWEIDGFQNNLISAKKFISENI